MRSEQTTLWKCSHWLIKFSTYTNRRRTFLASPRSQLRLKEPPEKPPRSVSSRPWPANGAQDRGLGAECRGQRVMLDLYATLAEKERGLILQPTKAQRLRSLPRK